MEAGQIFIDKARHLDALALTKYMLAHHDTYYMYSDGDKDVFRFAFLALRKRWAVPGRYVGAGGLPGRTASGDHCGLSMQVRPILHFATTERAENLIPRSFFLPALRPAWRTTLHPLRASSPTLSDLSFDPDLFTLLFSEPPQAGSFRSPQGLLVGQDQACGLPSPSSVLQIVLTLQPLCLLCLIQSSLSSSTPLIRPTRPRSLDWATSTATCLRTLTTCVSSIFALACPVTDPLRLPLAERKRTITCRLGGAQESCGGEGGSSVLPWRDCQVRQFGFRLSLNVADFLVPPPPPSLLLILALVGSPVLVFE